MSGEKHDPRQWYLRTGDKTVFGPVATRGFIVWAEQGRILPGHEVSCDRKTWLPAEQVPELDIAWYVDDGTGNLRGPLNRIAAEQILKSDKAPAGACLIAAKDADPARVVRPAEPVSAPVPDAPPPAARKDAPARAAGENAADPARLLEERDARIARLKQTVDRLERDLADARNLPLLGVTPETQVATAAASAAAAAREKAARATLQQALDTAQEAARARERDCAELRDAVAKMRAQAESAAAQVADRDGEIAQLKAAEAELLAFANTRDAELRARAADLEAQLAAAGAQLAEATRAAGREVLARAPEHDDLLRRVLSEEIETLDKDLARERDSFTTFKDLSAQRQEALQARMQELARLLRGDSAMPGSRVVRDTARTADVSRLQTELEMLRNTHEREAFQATEREHELLRRVRVLETEETRLRSQLGESDKQGRQLDELRETVRRREQELGLEQKHRTAEREQYQVAEQALLRRIEELERGGPAPAPEPLGSHEPPPPDNHIFRVMPWMRLRR